MSIVCVYSVIDSVYCISGLTGLTGSVCVYSIATEGQDYQSISSGSVTFPPNDTSQVIQITVMEDTLPELGEQFHVILTNATLLDTPASNLGTDGWFDITA